MEPALTPHSWIVMHATHPPLAMIALLGLVAALQACTEHLPDPYADFCSRVIPAMDTFMASQDFVPPRGDDATRYGGTLVIGGPADLVSMNPMTNAPYNGRQIQNFIVFSTLVTLDADLRTYVPALAEAFDLSADGTTLTFHLRQGVSWHDGEPVTAQDVAFTFERVRDPATGFPNEQYWERYVSVRVIDDLTVEFTLLPHANPLDPWRAMAIAPRHLLKDVPPGDLASHPFSTRCPVGSGPFRFVEHLEGQRWTYSANTAQAASLGGRPYLDRVVYRIIPDQTTLASELMTGAIDVFTDLGESVSERIQNSEAADVVTFPGRTYVYVAWNTHRPQLADPRVRRALAHATNRTELVEALMGNTAVRADGPVIPIHPAYDADLVGGDPVFDPELARTLLDEAGWTDQDGDGVREKDGVRLSFAITTGAGQIEKEGATQILQAQLAKVGVEAIPQVRDFATLIADMIARNFDAAIMTWTTDFTLDERNLFHSAEVDYDYAWTGITDPRLDRLLDELPEAPTAEAAKPLWDAYQLRLAEVQPYMYLWFARRSVGVHKRVHDSRMDARGDYLGISKWWIPADERGR